MAPEQRGRDRAPWSSIPDPWAPERRAAPTGPLPPLGERAAPTRGEVQRRRRMALAASIAWFALLLVCFGLRPDLGEHGGFVAAQLVVWGALLVAASRSARSRGATGLGVGIAQGIALALGVPLLFVALSLIWVSRRGAGGIAPIGEASRLFGCLSLGLLVAAPMIALASWAFYRSFPTAAPMRSALVGTACGLASALFLTLHCGVGLGGHIALGHGLALVAAIAGATIIVGRFGRA